MSFILWFCLIQQITFHSARSSSLAQNMGSVIQFYSLTYNTMLSQFTAEQFAFGVILDILPEHG